MHRLKTPWKSTGLSTPGRAPCSIVSSGHGKTRSACSTSAGWFPSAVSPPSRVPGEVRDTALKCPAGSFMVETDAPYLAPEPHRGKRNEPAYVRDTAEFLAALRGETLRRTRPTTPERTAAAFFRFRSA